INDAENRQRRAQHERLKRRHAPHRNRSCLCAAHERVRSAFPPLIQRGCACRRCGGPEDGLKERLIIDRRLRSEIKAHCGRYQYKQRQSRFDEFSEIAHEVRARGNDGRVIDYRRFHAGIGFGALCGRPRSVSLCEIRQQIALMLTPKDSITAPSATCAVAISAALLLQITQAPSAIWPKTKAIQRSDNRLRAAKSRISLQTRAQNATIAIAMINARNRCTICSQI